MGDVSTDPDLWGFCGDAAAQEAVVPDGAEADDHGLLPKPRPPRTGRLRLAPQLPADPVMVAVTVSGRALVSFPARVRAERRLCVAG